MKCADFQTRAVFVNHREGWLVVSNIRRQLTDCCMISVYIYKKREIVAILHVYN